MAAARSALSARSPADRSIKARTAQADRRRRTGFGCPPASITAATRPRGNTIDQEYDVERPNRASAILVDPRMSMNIADQNGAPHRC